MPRFARRLWHIEADDSAGAARIARLRIGLMLIGGGRIELVTKRLDIFSTQAIKDAVRGFEDSSDAIFLAGSGVMTSAAIRHFKVTPILFATRNDPVFAGFVKTMSAPGENRTGFTYFAEVFPAIFIYLARINPRMKAVAILTDSIMQSETKNRIQALATRFPTLRIECWIADTFEELQNLIRAVKRRHIDAVVALETSAVVKDHAWLNAQLIELHCMCVHFTSSFVAAGGLLGYVAVHPDPYGVWTRQIGLMIAGVPIKQIPVESPRQFRLYLNLKSAEALGLSIPVAVLKAAHQTFY
jgi:putative tryptophan/tyrosine transport system substrate-binding protein